MSVESSWLQSYGTRKEPSMSCRLAPVWALALVSLAGSAVRAQNPFPKDLIPGRTVLGRLGLERQWLAVVPLYENERLIRISRSEELFFAQTSSGSIHTFDVNSGKHLWSANLGGSTPYPIALASNSYAVFGTVANFLVALDRKSGRTLWKTQLGAIPTSGTSCDEDQVIVGTATGRVLSFQLRDKPAKGEPKIRAVPVEKWSWQTSGQIHTLPLPAQHVTAFGSSDGRVYVVMNEERTTLYRFRTGGPIADGLGAYGTRTLLIPSADHNLYAIDLLTSDVQWTFPSGAPIEQAPLVAGDSIYVVNQSGNLSSIDPATGSPHWTTPTEGGQFTAVGASKLYLRSWAFDLYLIDRETGKVLADPAATLQRAGLNLHELRLSFLNRFDDRMYFASDSGMVVCLRELGATQPRLLRDPKALPFGYIPPEGIKKTPPNVPAADNAIETSLEPKEAAPKDAEPKEETPPPAAPSRARKPAAKSATPKAATPKAATPKAATADQPQ
jgi:outer membrane protein assembly factor BamB